MRQYLGVLVAAALLFGGCVGQREYSPPPPPRSYPTATPYPATPVEEQSTEDTGDTDVYVDHDDDDGESWFCQRRRWC